MILRRDIRERIWLVPYVLCASVLLAAPAGGQDPPTAPEQIKAEIKAVVRISKPLIAEVVDRQEVVASIPFDASIVRFCCQGVLDGFGKLSVDLSTDRGDGMFVINGHGTCSTYVRGVRGPFVALGPAWGSFTSLTVVRFDGRRFHKLDTTASAEVHAELHRVEGRRGTRVGRAVGRMIRPLGQRLVPRAEREGTPIGEYYLATFVDGVADEIVSRLNHTTQVEASLNRLFPETKDWEFQLSTDPDFMEAAFGPPGSEMLILPENPGRLENARMELWVRSTTKGAEALEKLSKSPLAKQLLQGYLEATLPELAALTQEKSVTAVGPWVVIGIGAPHAE